MNGGGAVGPATGAIPSVAPTAIRRRTIAATRSSGAATRSPSTNVQCSRPSTPAATPSTIASSAWACAVTGKPCRCASSTSAASSSGVNCGAPRSEPAVSAPPEAITLITSTPRSACSRTASRTPRPATPPRKWQCPPDDVIGGPAATIVGSAAVDSRRRRVR